MVTNQIYYVMVFVFVFVVVFRRRLDAVVEMN